MTVDLLRQRISVSSVDIPTLARDLLIAARRDVRSAIQLWRDEASFEAAHLLSSMREVSLSALVDLRDSVSANQAFWLAGTIGVLFGDLKRRVLQRYRGMSVDRRHVFIASSEDGDPETTRRVCDAAYLACYAILEADPSPLQTASKQASFFELEEVERDRVIAEFYHSPRFLNALGDEPL